MLTLAVILIVVVIVLFLAVLMGDDYRETRKFNRRMKKLREDLDL